MAASECAHAPSSPSRRFVYAQRLVWCMILFGAYIYRQVLQDLINSFYTYLLSTWLFNSVYFETWWATACYPILLAVPFLMDKVSWFDKYKLDPALEWQDAGIKKILCEVVVYCLPLMTLDTFMVKRYCGVDPAEWDTRSSSWIQHTRALPQNPPSVGQVMAHLIFSFVVYDAIFFLVHFTVHKNIWLYKHIHAEHHEHHLVHSRVSNQLTVPERIVLVLSANQALKFCRSHPLTRAIFVPLFVGWIIENHCGYDLPFTLDKVIPFGLLGGTSSHFKHHQQGSRHYQPFFTYIDKYFLPFLSKVKKNKLL